MDRLGGDSRAEEGRRICQDLVHRHCREIVLMMYTSDAFARDSVISAVLKGDRIAQLILERILTPEVEEVLEGEELEVTKRGAGGYGSTGV